MWLALGGNRLDNARAAPGGLGPVYYSSTTYYVLLQNSVQHSSLTRVFRKTWCNTAVVRITMVWIDWIPPENQFQRCCLASQIGILSCIFSKMNDSSRHKSNSSNEPHHLTKRGIHRCYGCNDISILNRQGFIH